MGDNKCSVLLSIKFSPVVQMNYKILLQVIFHSFNETMYNNDDWNAEIFVTTSSYNTLTYKLHVYSLILKLQTIACCSNRIFFTSIEEKIIYINSDKVITIFMQYIILASQSRISVILWMQSFMKFPKICQCNVNK